MKPLGEDIGLLVLRRHLDEPHLAILDDLVGEVLPDVDVLGSLTAADDVVALFKTRRVVLVDRDRFPLPESKSAQKVPEVQDLPARRRCRVVLGLRSRERRRLLHLRLPHDRLHVVQHDHAGRRPAGRAIAPVCISIPGQ